MTTNDPEKNRAYVKKHYDNNKEYYLEKNRRARQRKAEYIRLQREQPCTDCGVEYPWYVMEFDHVEPKFKAVSSMLSNSWRQIKDEIAKCEVVCANCHATRTHMRRSQ